MWADPIPGDQLLALRHSQVLGAAGLCYGQSEIPLAESFGAELKSIKDKLKAFSLDRIYSSPLQRCQRLAIGLDLGPVTLMSNLKELDFGDWESLHWHEIPLRESVEWTSNIVTMRPPNGESFADLIERVAAFLETLSPPPLGQSYLFVTHAGVMRALLHLLSEQSPRQSLDEAVNFGQIFGWNPWPGLTEVNLPFAEA